MVQKKIMKMMKIDGKVNVPVEVDENNFVDRFLEWVENSKFEFMGKIEDESKN